mgnify:CR=1 FL=1
MITVHTFKKEAKLKLQKLRKRNDVQKKRWVVAVSSISLIVILMLWIVYLNLSLPSFKDKTVTREEHPQKTTEGGFFTTFRNGFAALSEGVQNSLKNFKNPLQKSNEFSFEKNGAQYTPPKPEIISPTELH